MRGGAAWCAVCEAAGARSRTCCVVCATGVSGVAGARSRTLRGVRRARRAGVAARACVTACGAQHGVRCKVRDVRCSVGHWACVAMTCTVEVREAQKQTGGVRACAR